MALSPTCTSIFTWSCKNPPGEIVRQGLLRGILSEDGLVLCTLMPALGSHQHPRCQSFSSPHCAQCCHQSTEHAASTLDLWHVICIPQTTYSIIAHEYHKQSKCAMKTWHNSFQHQSQMRGEDASSSFGHLMSPKQAWNVNQRGAGVCSLPP